VASKFSEKNIPRRFTTANKQKIIDPNDAQLLISITLAKKQAFISHRLCKSHTADDARKLVVK
jgi:hypothetical protein